MSGANSTSPAPVGSLAAPPSAAVLAVIAAAVDQVWPRPVAEVVTGPDQDRASWRFSGRWWSRPMLLRRERPR